MTRGGLGRCPALAATGILLLCTLLFAWPYIGGLFESGVVAAERRTNAVRISYAEAQPIVDGLREDLVPADLRVRGAAAREKAWAAWTSRRDAELRERLTRGDEDSIVNLFWFGTSFTRQPRLTPQRLATLNKSEIDAIFSARLDDLAAGIAAPNANERLLFARGVLSGRGVDVASSGAAQRVRAYLEQLVERSLTELAAYQSAPPERQSTLFSERGLSSDTSLFVDFSLEQALTAVTTQGLLARGSVNRVAIVGPGLDFADKEGGFDFYPTQTIQPFAVADSLMRLGLASPSLRMTTFDVSARVNEHLTGALARARGGQNYVMHLPLATTKKWHPDLLRFWERLGERIGETVDAPPVPDEAGDARIRSVAVRPAVVQTLDPLSLNIVLQRQELSADERFDLVIATNVLVYYDVFEQSLALSNIARMLRPRGLLLSSDFVYPLPAVPMALAGDTRVSYEEARTDDIILWYQRN